MQCTDCNAAKQTDGKWTRYNTPQCIHCTARLIKRIGAYPIPASEAHARQLAVSRDAIAYGHQNKEIRRLVKMDAMPLKEASK